MTDADIDRIADAVPVDQIGVHITTWHRRFARAVLAAAPQPKPIAYGMPRADGLILDVITPEEHESYSGEYTVPLYATPPAAPAEPCYCDRMKIGVPGVSCGDCPRDYKPAPAVPVAWAKQEKKKLRITHMDMQGEDGWLPLVFGDATAPAPAVPSDAAPHDDIGRAALLVLSPEILAELLQLPDGCHIDHATAPHDQPGVLHLRVRGAGWPTKAGWLLPQVRGTVTRHHAEDGSVLRQTIDWGFPKDEGPNVAANRTAAGGSG